MSNSPTTPTTPMYLGPLFIRYARMFSSTTAVTNESIWVGLTAGSNGARILPQELHCNVDLPHLTYWL